LHTDYQRTALAYGKETAPSAPARTRVDPRRKPRRAGARLPSPSPAEPTDDDGDQRQRDQGVDVVQQADEIAQDPTATCGGVLGLLEYSIAAFTT